MLGQNALPNFAKNWANSAMAAANISYGKDQDYRTGIFKIADTDKWEDRVLSTHFTGSYGLWNDGQVAPQADIKEGYKSFFTQVPMGKEYAIGRLAKLNTDLMGIGNPSAKAGMDCGDDAYLMQQLAAYSYLYYGNAASNTFMTAQTHSTVSMVQSDGQNFFSASHPSSPDVSTTWSNYLTGAAYTPSQDVFKEAIHTLDSQRDGKGQKLHLGRRGVIWCVSLQDYAAAKEVIASDKKPDSLENNINVTKGSYNGCAIELRVVPWLSHFAEASYYPHFIVDRMAVEKYMPLVVLDYKKFTPETYTDNRTDTMYIRGSYIQSVGTNIGRGIVGIFPS